MKTELMNILLFLLFMGVIYYFSFVIYNRYDDKRLFFIYLWSLLGSILLYVAMMSAIVFFAKDKPTVFALGYKICQSLSLVILTNLMTVIARFFVHKMTSRMIDFHVRHNHLSVADYPLNRIPMIRDFMCGFFRVGFLVGIVGGLYFLWFRDYK